MTDVATGKENLTQLAIQGNYSDVTSQDMAKVYSRNIAKQQISGSKLAHGALLANKNAESLAEGHPAFAEE